MEDQAIGIYPLQTSAMCGKGGLPANRRPPLPRPHPPRPPARRPAAPWSAGWWKERESGERSLISQSGPPVEHNCKTAFSAVRPTFSGAPSIPIRQSDDTFRGSRQSRVAPSRSFLGLFFEPTNKQITALFDDSMLPKVIAEQRDHCYLPTLGYQKTAKLQLPPPNSLLPYNSYYIIYIQFPVRSGFVVGQIHE